MSLQSEFHLYNKIFLTRGSANKNTWRIQKNTNLNDERKDGSLQILQKWQLDSKVNKENFFYHKD